MSSPALDGQPLLSPASSARPRSDGERTLAFRADLEGVRGIAVLLVVLFHCGLAAARGGFVGVDVFFVLSGYLITGLLVQELDATGRVDLARFYARRARRLLPAATVVLLFTLATSVLVFSPLELAEVARSARATAAYLSNVRFMLGATDYFAAGNDDNPLLHTWSLAVEEQFYMVWPLLLWLGLRRAPSRRRLVGLMVGISVASFVGCVWLTSVRQPWAFFASPARAWEFGLGALAGLIPAATLLARPRFCVLLGIAGLLAIVAASALFTATTPFPGAAVLLPVVGTAAMMVAGVGAPGAGVGRVLETAPLQYLGRRSYSWYLWHWPVLMLALAWYGALSLGGALLAAAVSLALAELAFRFVENPIRFHPRLLHAPAARSLVLAAVVTGGSIVVADAFFTLAHRQLERPPYRQLAAAAEDLPRLYRDGCLSEATQSTPHACAYGDPYGATLVVGFGDSHTAQWFPALDSLAHERHWRMVYFSKSGCPSTALGLPIYNQPLQRVETECAIWRDSVIARIAGLQPSVVVVSNSVAYVALPGATETRARLTLPEWRDGTRRTIEALRISGAKVLLLRDSPRPGMNIPRCLARTANRPWTAVDACVTPRDLALDRGILRAEIEALRGVSGAAMIDLASAFCDATRCPPIRNGIVVYRDGNHVTTAYMRSLTAQVGVVLDRALNRIDVSLASSHSTDRARVRVRH